MVVQSECLRVWWWCSQGVCLAQPRCFVQPQCSRHAFQRSIMAVPNERPTPAVCCTTVCLTAPHAGCTTTLAPLFRSGRLSQSLDSMEAQFTTFDRLYSSVESGLQSIHQFHELILENLFSFKSVVFYANMLAVA